MTVQVKASFGKDKKHLDGLDHHRKEMIDSPLRPRVIVAVVNVSSITHDVLDGTDTPRIQFQQVEVLDGADAMKAIDMLNGAYQRRTGREDSQASLFDEWDPGAPTAEATDAHRAEAIHDAPVLDAETEEDPRSAEEIMAERAEAKAEEADDAQDEAGVPWVPDAPEGAAADWEPPAVEFQAPDGDDPEPPATTRRKRR